MFGYRIFFSALFLTFTSLWNLYANGGPVDGSSLYRAGHPVFLQMSHLELISEKLEISILDDYTTVHVTYLLQNKSNKSTGKIYYGFPVDYSYNNEFYEDTLKYISSVSFKCNGKILPVIDSVMNPNRNEYEKIVMEKYDSDFTSEGEIITIKNEESEKVSLKRNWFYTHFSIPANELVSLEVSYTVKNYFEDWISSKSYLTSYSERQVLYDFSPAAYWGNSKVKYFQIIINSPERLRIMEYPFKQNGNIYTFSATDFDFQTASPLKILYNNDIKFAKEINSGKLKRNQIKSIKASSFKDNYPARNILDGNTATAWVAGKTNSGINEWVEFEPSDSTIGIGAIFLIAGYTKSEKAYYENNRIKKLKIEIETSADYENYRETSVDVDLEDLPYQAIDINTFIPMSHAVADYGELPKPFKKIRFTILDVYKGTTYDDTCISEIFLLGGLLSRYYE